MRPGEEGRAYGMEEIEGGGGGGLVKGKSRKRGKKKEKKTMCEDGEKGGELKKVPMSVART